MDTPEASSSEPPSSPASSSSDDAPGREPGRDTGHGGLRLELLDPDRLLDAGVFARTQSAAGSVLALISASGEVRARVVDDAAMSAAHLEHMDDAGTTDVLTFDMSDEEGVDADLLICRDEARRHAERLGHPLEHELALYIVHGVLHCVGHDDATEEGAERMHAEEDRLLAAAGIGPVYGAGADPGGAGLSDRGGSGP